MSRVRRRNLAAIIIDIGHVQPRYFFIPFAVVSAAIAEQTHEDEDQHH